MQPRKHVHGKGISGIDGMLLVLMETHVLTYMGGLKSKLCNRIRVNFHGKKSVVFLLFLNMSWRSQFEFDLDNKISILFSL